MYKDEELGFAQGDWIVSGEHNEKLYRFRSGSVPRFARWGFRSRFRHYSRRPCGSFRYPKTISSIKSFHAHEFESRYGDEPFKVRVKNNKRLPTAWDDQYVKRERSWKDFRKTQYKE